MERMTGLEPATSTLARWRSTRWATSAYSWCLRPESNQRHVDFQSTALPTELQRQKEKWRPGTGSNRRPLAWQASVLTNWTTGPLWWEQQGSNLWPSACKADALPAELCSHIAILSLSLYRNDKSNYITKNLFVNTFLKKIQIFSIFFGYWFFLSKPVSEVIIIK